jgi:hypothetical protein
MSFWQHRWSAFFVGLIFLSFVVIRFQNTLIQKWQNSSGSLTEKANNLVAIQADVPEDYRGFGVGGVYCQNPGEPLIPIPGSVVSFDGPHSVPAQVIPNGVNIPNPIPPKNVTTIPNGSFTTGNVADSLGVGVNTLWLALKNGWWKPNVRFVSLPSTLPAAITNPNFRSQTPTAQFCGNGALGLCQNSNLCGGGNTFYNSCDMTGLSEEQAIPLLGGFVFLFTNCAAAPTTTQTPTPSPATVPACLTAKMQVKVGSAWQDYNPQTHTIKVGDAVRFSVTGWSITLKTAKFNLLQGDNTTPVVVNSTTRTINGNNVTFTTDYTIASGTTHKVTAEVFQ